MRFDGGGEGEMGKRHPRRLTRRFAWFAVCVAALAALLVGASPGFAQYTLPTGHPRVFFNDATFAAIADRCKVGGTHRAHYTALLAFADAKIAQARYDYVNIPNYALVYRIHRYWNQTGYQGGGFVEDKYWQAARTGVLNGGNWGSNELGSMSAITTDWIWEKLTTAQISQAASFYGAPSSSNPGSAPTWRAGTSNDVVTKTLRSILFTGAGINDVGYAAEYQSILGYIVNTLAPALQLQGGVGALGPQYENDIMQFNRSWSVEAMRAASGTDPWPLCQKWASEFGRWNTYARNPLTNEVSLQQDALAFNYGVDTPWNSALLALRGRDPFAQRITTGFWQSSQSWQTDDYRKRALWCLVLWYDPTLAPYDPATAPLSVRLSEGGMDHVYMKSSWTDPDPMMAHFEAGKYFYGHQHLSAGSFTITRKGYLALDSGGYYTYSATAGGDHNDYFKRSSAHNVLHVYDPAETFWSPTSSSQALINDGGQHFPPSDPSYNDLLTKPVYSPGQMLRYEAAGLHTYAQANLAGAYNSSALMQMYGKPPYTNKITTYTREFFFSRPDIFVVIDRVRAKSASLSKVWNLHVSDVPQVTGTAVQRMGNATAGVWEYAGAEVLKVTDTNPDFDRGSMFVKSLYPKQRMIRVIGGGNRSASGFAYWSGGINGSGRYDPTLGSNHYWGSWYTGREYLENSIWATPIGWGRVEVEPTVQALDDIFLHVLIPCDEALVAMPDTRLIESPNAVGAEIVNRQVIVFGRTETANLDSVTYTVAANDTAAIHTIVDLTPGGAYRVFKSGATYFLRKATHPAPPGATEIVTPPPTATQAGVVEFASVGGSLQIQMNNVAVQYQAGILGATITWQTDRASDSQVEFGTSTAYGQASPLLPALVTSHSVSLSAPAILNDVLYQFRAVSRAPGGYVGASANSQFRSDAVAPSRVSNLLVR